MGFNLRPSAQSQNGRWRRDNPRLKRGTGFALERARRWKWPFRDNNTLGGAISSDVEGAYPHRAFPYLGESQAYWESASHAAVLRAAIDRMRNHIAQAGVTSHYANYPDLAFGDWPTAYYGAENYARLQQLKQRYDPQNRIRYPRSVQLPV
jgi:FAD/FMN-containing dehydrogenase